MTDTPARARVKRLSLAMDQTAEASTALSSIDLRTCNHTQREGVRDAISGLQVVAETLRTALREELGRSTA